MLMYPPAFFLFVPLDVLSFFSGAVFFFIKGSSSEESPETTTGEDINIKKLVPFSFKGHKCCVLKIYALSSPLLSFFKTVLERSSSERELPFPDHRHNGINTRIKHQVQSGKVATQVQR